MTLECSVVIFRPWNICGLNHLNRLISQNKLLSFLFPSPMAPKRPILFYQCEMDHQKSTFLLIFSTLMEAVEAIPAMRPELNLKDKSQMSSPNQYTDNFKSNLILYDFAIIQRKTLVLLSCKRFEVL